MSEQLKYIIQELNKPPFSKTYNLISFDTLETLQLLQILTDVFAQIDPKHKVDVREEAADQTAIRLLTMLRVLKYRPPPETDQNAFRQGLVQGDKLVVYPILEWLLQRIPDLKKRAYLAKYLVKLEIAPEFRSDDQVDDLYQQYETLITEFKEIHKQSEQLRQSGYNTADIKKDISSMEDEKEQLIKRVERLKRKVESQSNSGQMLAAARDLRLEKDREEKIKKQKHEQKNGIIQLSQRLERLQQQIKDVKQASIGATPEGLLAKLEEETKVNSYMLKDRLPKEITGCKKTVGDLQRVVAEPAMGQSDLDVIKKKIHEMNSEVNQLVEKRMMSSDPMDDKLSLFRQQAAIIARKKEVAAEKLREAREELERYEREASEKQEYMKQCDGADTIKGEDFKRYVNKLRTKSTIFKKKRQEMAELRAEAGVLSRTGEILKNRQDNVNKQLSRMERKQGVTGYRDTQEALENVSAMKSDVDVMKGQTLEDISSLVNQLMKKIQDKRNALAPIVSELRVTRSSAQELTSEYEEKKTAYESIAAGLESNSSKLEQEVRTYREELSAEETRFHYLNAMIRIVEIQQERIQDEVKSYMSSDPHEKKKALREQYSRKIQEQENLGKSLRDQQKLVRESQGGNLRQMNMWRDLERLMGTKLGGGMLGHRAGGDKGGNMRLGMDPVPFGHGGSAADEDRLVL